MKTKKVLKWSDIAMAKLLLEKLVYHFAHSNKAEGKSPRTVGWYSEMLMTYLKFLVSQGRETVLEELNMYNVRDFIVFEQGRNISPFTVQCRVRALKAFSKWLFSEEYTMKNILEKLRLPRVPEKLLEPLTNEEVNALVSYQNPLTAIGSRNLAILAILLDAGLREGELCNQTFEDAHIEKGFLKLMGKGAKERVVPIGASAQKVTMRYVFHFRPEPVSTIDNFLFLTLDGRKLSNNAVKLLLKRWGKKAGVPRLHAHLCRHTFATNYLVYECGDVFRLQQILGHSTLEMVKSYVHYASSQAMINSNVSTPLDRMPITKLRGYKIDRELRKKHGRQAG